MLLKFKNLSDYPSISHFISERGEGVSEKPYDSLNLAFHVKDKDEQVSQNRKILAKKLNIQLDNFITLKQIHSNNIAVVTEKDKGKGSNDFESAIDNTDAIITQTQNLCLMVLVADCVPVLLYDPETKTIAAIHAGWKGTIKDITYKTVGILKSKFNINPENLIAGMGPAVGPCCFKLDNNTAKSFEKYSFSNDIVVKKTAKGTFIDLWEANKEQLTEQGVLEKNIEIMDVCTACNVDRFFSYRAENEITGRFGAGIMLM